MLLDVRKLHALALEAVEAEQRGDELAVRRVLRRWRVMSYVSGPLKITSLIA